MSLLRRFMLLAMGAYGLVAVCTPAYPAGIELSGAGATFPHPLYQAMFDAFARQHTLKVQYEAVGSGEGMRRLLDRKVDFGATDAYRTGPESAALAQVPTCLGAVVLTYSLPGNPKLRLSPDVIAELFLGTITRWTDPRITGLNAGRRLPDLPVHIVHRSDSSGTTFIFTDYLAKTSRTWKERVGSGISVSWPLGVAGAGNPGVASQVKQVPGSIGYVELLYALGNELMVADVRNRAGRFIVPTPDTVALAAQTTLPDDTNVSLTDTSVPEAYPISSFTWLALYKEQDYDARSRDKSDALVRLLWWVTHEGQAHARPLFYAPLPKEAVRKAEGLLRTVTFAGQPILR
jgi:phosphate transport system substrate-binding protein